MNQKIYRPIICFATAFYHAGGSAPNIKKSKNIKSKFDKYYKCIIVLFASIRRFNTSENLYIFSDRLLPKKYNSLLEQLNIKTIIIDESKIEYVNNQNLDNKFPGCLFTLDVIRYFSEDKKFNKFDALCLLDSDIVMQTNNTSIYENVSYNNTAMGIIIDYPLTKKTNGQSIIDLCRIHNDYYHNKINKNQFHYFGGEFLLLSKHMIRKISLEIEHITQHIESNVTIYGKVFTEEHILTVVLNHFNNDIDFNSEIVKRVWTTDTHTNICSNENNYHLLHMPAEKDKLFHEIYNYLDKVGSTYLNNLSNKDYNKLILRSISERKNPTTSRLIKILIKKNFIRLKGLFR